VRLRNFTLAATLALCLLAVSQAHAAWQFTRSVNDGSSGNDITVSGLNFSLSGNFTVAGWVKHNTGNFNFGQHDVLVSCWNSGSDDQLSLLIHGWGDVNWGKLTVVTDSADVNTGTNRPFQGNTSETHVAIRRNGTSLTFWVNGTSIGTATVPDAMVLNNCSFGSWGWDYLQGSLWNWAIWTRDLSNAEIASLSQRAAPECYRNGLVLSLPMIVLQELAQGGTVTNGSEDNPGVTLAAQPRMIFCGE